MNSLSLGMWQSICFKEQSVHVICFLAHCQFTFLKQITGTTVLEGRTKGARGRKETLGLSPESQLSARAKGH